MIVTRAFIPWSLDVDAPAALELVGCIAGDTGEGALAADLIRAEVAGIFLDRLGVWSGGDIALVRILTRASGGFGVVMTHSSIDSTNGAALLFAGHMVVRHARGPLTRPETEEIFEPWDVFERWLRVLGGPALFQLAEAASSVRHDRKWQGSDPGPPPGSSWVLLFAPGEEARAASELLGSAWVSTRVTEELLLARGPHPPSVEVRRSLAAAHGRGAFWSLSGDGPPRCLEDLYGDVQPLPNAGEGLLKICSAVAILGGMPAGVVSMPERSGLGL